MLEQKSWKSCALQSLSGYFIQTLYFTDQFSTFVSRSGSTLVTDALVRWRHAAGRFLRRRRLRRYTDKC
uniref:Uncharacterized protein n=1 Tax=Oryzias latipes TaxID=8090 RepID=A0A3P9KMU1_ORYLA